MMPNSSLANLTSAYRNTSIEPQDSKFCPLYSRADFEAGGSSVPHIVNAALNVTVAITTTLGNLLILLVMRRVKSIRLPSKLLLSSLVVTDLGIGLVVHPQLIALSLTKVTNSYSVGIIFANSVYVTAAIFCCASLFTMIAISLDRYAVLYFHIRYQDIITARRVYTFLAFTWSLTPFLGLTYLWNTSFYCYFTICGILSTFLFISGVYIKIYWVLRGQHGNQVQPEAQGDQAQQQETGNTLDMAKYRKTAATMLWIYVIFMICYLPHVSMYVVIAAMGCSPLIKRIHEISYILVLLNSCINPLVYCIRIREIRTKVLEQVRLIICPFDEE